MSGETPFTKPEESAPDQQHSGLCRQKLILLTAYETLVAQHAAALAELTQQIGTATRLEYVAMYRATEVLRKDVADMREELEWHNKQHGC